MNSSTAENRGWLASVRRISESLMALMRSRFELFTVELQEEKLRVVNLLVWLTLAAALGACGIAMCLVTLALWLWTVAGYLGLIALAVITLLAALFMLWTLRRRIQSDPLPFSQTLAEFRKDAECLRKK